MANIGIRGGEIADIDYYNRMVRSYQLNQLRNIMLNSKKWVYDGGASNIGEASWYWNTSKNVSVVTFQVTYSGTALTSAQPPIIASCVDRTGTAVSYAAVGIPIVQTQAFSSNGVNFTLHITLQEYQNTSGTSQDVFCNVEAFSTVKDMRATEFIQMMIIQHDDALTTLTNVVADGDTSNSTDFSRLATHYNAGEKLSWITSVDTEQGIMELSNSIPSFNISLYDWQNLEFYSNNSVIYLYSDDFWSDGFAYTNFRQIDATVTSYAKANLFNFNSSQALAAQQLLNSNKTYGGKPDKIVSFQDDVRHVNFPLGGRFVIGSRSTNDSLNAAQLYQLSQNHENFSKFCFCERNLSPVIQNISPLNVSVRPECFNVLENKYDYVFYIGQASDVPVNYNIRLD